mgnify:FL=1
MVNKKINLENKMIEDIGLSKLNIYNDSMKLSNKIWDIVNVLDYFVKDTIGKQLVRSADSISANISEGYGRYSFKENIWFLYYSRGSLYETITWINKATRRGIIKTDRGNLIEMNLTVLLKMQNVYIKNLKPKL